MARIVFPSIVLLLTTAALGYARDQPEIDVQISSPRIYFGQTFDYRVEIRGGEGASRPELDVSPDFEASYRGKQQVGFQQIIVNGRIIKNDRGIVTHIFQLKPRRTGQLEIPAPRVTMDGRVYAGPVRTVQVLPPDAQDVVSMQILADRQSVYPMQPFTVTLLVAVKGVPDPYAKTNPMQVQNRMPALEIPWVADQDLPQGLTPEVAWRDWLNPLMNHGREGGFSVNGLSAQSTSLFDVFDGPRNVAFLPKSRIVARKTTQGTVADYWLYEFARTFLPKMLGRYTFGPVNVEGTFANGLDARQRPRGESIYAVAEPIVVTVQDAPLEGRPDSYTGAVGSFSLHATLEPKECKLGDPITLTLKLTGQGTLEQAQPPDLKRIGKIAERFKIYEATAQVKGDSCRFTYALRPRQAGADEFPPIPISYFDVQTERYVTLRTEPIPIRITQADRLSDDQIVSAQQDSPGGSSELEARREGIFANVTDPAAVRDQRAHPTRWLITLAGMFGFYAFSALTAGQVRRLTGDRSLVRRRSAPLRARKQINSAAAAFEENRARQGCDLVYAAVVGLVADVADLPDAGMTPKDVDKQLETLGIDGELRRRVGGLLQGCDAARYGAPEETGRLGHQAQALLEEVIAALKAGRRFR